MSAATDYLARQLDSLVKEFMDGEIEFVLKQDGDGTKRFRMERVNAKGV